MSDVIGTVAVSLTDLCVVPNGPRARQLLFGEDFRVTDQHDGWAFGTAMRDGYAGCVRADDLAAHLGVTHQITARSSHLYQAPDFKSPEIAPLSLGARLAVVGGEGRFARLAGGQFVPQAHISPISPVLEPVLLAEKYLGSPYLWGGNSIFGIDCSGLVQAVLHGCDVACPGDTDMQERAVGVAIDASTRVQPGDLIFWRGHVAILRDKQTLIHANAHDMAVVIEPVAAAIKRIEAQGDGPVTARRRPDYPGMSAN